MRSHSKKRRKAPSDAMDQDAQGGEEDAEQRGEGSNDNIAQEAIVRRALSDGLERQSQEHDLRYALLFAILDSSSVPSGMRAYVSVFLHRRARF